MTIQLTNSSVVINAEHFNPSIASQIWLIDNDIIHREEFLEGAVFTPMFIQVPTRDFQLLIVPDNCQFSIAPHAERQQELIMDRVGRIISTLPHTPYKSIGLNFLWHHVVERGTITKITRELFYDSNNRLHQLFNSDDAQFGCYVSKDSLGCRLRLDIKPIMMMESATGQNKSAVQFAFNYHYEVVNRLDAVSEITQKLGQWENAKTDSSQIFQTTLRDR